MKRTLRLLTILFALGSTLCLAACSFTVGADGSKSGTVDGDASAKLAKILLDK
jgi:hypothetical protein